MRISISLSLIFLSLILSGCATIMHGSTQEISVNSSPSNALVLVNSIEMGYTPIVIELKRNEKHIITLELEGFEPYEIALSRKVSPWVAGNLAFGGVIGLAVDAITGGLYELTPEQLNATLLEIGMDSSALEERIYIHQVLKPQASWKQVGNLVPNVTK